MNKLSNLLLSATVITSLSGLLPVPAQALAIPSYQQVQASLISQGGAATFFSERSNSGINQRCKYFFYDGGDFKQTCSSFINSGYTTPRTRTSNASGYWETDGSTVRVMIVSPNNLSGQIIYQKGQNGALISPSGIRLYPD